MKEMTAKERQDAKMASYCYNPNLFVVRNKEMSNLVEKC